MREYTKTDCESNIDSIESSIRGALAFGADPADVADAICASLNMSRLSVEQANNLRVLLALAAKDSE